MFIKENKSKKEVLTKHFLKYNRYFDEIACYISESDKQVTARILDLKSELYNELSVKTIKHLKSLRGIAKLHPEDAWDSEKGCELAMQRLIAQGLAVLKQSFVKWYIETTELFDKNMLKHANKFCRDFQVDLKDFIALTTRSYDFEVDA